MVYAQSAPNGLKKRSDIFSIESDARLRYVNFVFLTFALILGTTLSRLEIMRVPVDYFEPNPIQQNPVIFDNKPVEIKKPVKARKEVHKKILKQVKKDKLLRPKPAAGVGSGDPKARVNHKHLLYLLMGAGKNMPAGVSADTRTMTGDIDKTLKHYSGFKTRGKPGIGRKGLHGDKYNQGYAGDGGSGGVDKVLDNLTGGVETVRMARRPKVGIDKEVLKHISGVSMGGRSPADIAAVVQRHVGGLRYAYNKRLKNNPGLKGKVTVMWTINKKGRVVSISIKGTNIEDQVLLNEVVSRIKAWRFGECTTCSAA